VVVVLAVRMATHQLPVIVVVMVVTTVVGEEELVIQVGAEVLVVLAV
jgi:hypothetical protein